MPLPDKAEIPAATTIRVSGFAVLAMTDAIDSEIVPDLSIPVSLATVESNLILTSNAVTPFPVRSLTVIGIVIVVLGAPVTFGKLTVTWAEARDGKKDWKSRGNQKVMQNLLTNRFIKMSP